MNKQAKKIIVFIGFFVLFIGSALFMYFNFVHNKPRGRWEKSRTDVDPRKFDSILKARAQRPQDTAKD